MANEKELKITTVLSAKGGEAAQRDIENLRKAFEAISRALKDTQRAMDAFVGGTKQAAKETQTLNEALKNQATYIQNVDSAQRKAGGGVMAGGGGGAYYMGRGGVTSGNGADYNGPVSAGGGGRGGIPWGGIKTGLGIATAIGGAAVGAYNVYNQYEQHRAQREITEKTLGIDNLARSQSYKNSVFFESRSSPQGYQAYKDAYQFRVKTRDAGKSTVDANGNIVSGGGERNFSGLALTNRAINMTGENDLIQAQKRGGWGKIAGGAVGILGGLGGMAYGGGLIAAGAAASSTGVGALAGVPAIAAGVGAGGAGMGAIWAGFRAVFDGYHQIQSTEKKLQESELEGQQAEKGVGVNGSMDAILAIKQYQMGAFQSDSGAMLSAGQSALDAGAYSRSLGMSALDMGSATGLQAGVNRNFGAAGHAAIGSAYNAAGFHGMSVGAASNIAGTFQTLGGDKHALEEMFAAGVRNGMSSLDMGFFEKFGMAAAKAGYSESGGAGDPRFAAAALMGGRQAPNKFEVDERVRGLDTMSSLFQTNPYFKGRGMASAAHVLGRGATGGKIHALQSASFSELMSGKGNEETAAFGISSSQLQSFGNAEIQHIGDVAMNSPDIDASTKAAIKDMGMPGFLQDLRRRLASKNPAEAAAARKQLNNLGVAGKSVGVAFTTMRGAMEVAGTNRHDITNLNAKGKQPGGVAIGAAVQNRSGVNAMRREDDQAGQSLTEDVTTARQNLADAGQAFQTKHAKEMATLADNSHASAKQKAAAARTIMQAYGHDKGAAAAGVGDGDQSTQGLTKQFGALNNAALTLTSYMDGLARILSKMPGMVPARVLAAPSAASIKGHP